MGQDSTSDSEFSEKLRELVGQSGPVTVARDSVNQAMIRHWCDAMGDHNPCYIDPAAAAASNFGQIVAPPAMLNAWNMPGLAGRDPEAAKQDPSGQVFAMLDAAGFTSVVATDSSHVYTRYLELGDVLHATGTLTSVSDEKKTALGVGHFVTSETEYVNQHGDPLGRMTFKILKFKPGTGRMAAAESGTDTDPASATSLAPSTLPPMRPKPGVSRDTQFFWDGVEQEELRIQQCECGALHHPPMVRCPDCGRYELGWVVSSGRGVVYSHVEVNHPKVPGFDYPLAVALIELEEGTRIISNVVGLAPEKLAAGLQVECFFQEFADGSKLPLFRPITPSRNETTLHFDDVSVGDELAPCPIPITPTLIVATAIASRDYQDVHHDRQLAIKRGSPDIFMNILTSSGLTARYVTDWAGPEARLANLSIRLGVPNYPGDSMTMAGEVTEKTERDGQRFVTVKVVGMNRMGPHLSGTVEVELA